MRLASTLFLLISLASHGQAAEMRIVLNGDNTKATFVGAKPEGKHEGGFKSLSGVAIVDSTNPATLKFHVDLDMASIYSDNDMLTGHLKSPDFFDIRNHPKARFVSTRVEQVNDQYQITGQLTLLGRTREISFPARIAVNEGGMALASSFKINRTEFGMTYGKGKIYDEVTVNVNLRAGR